MAPYLLRLANGTVIQVSRLLYLVVAHLDGRRDLGEVATEVSTAVGRTVSAGNVDFLVSQKLRPLGIVAGDDCDPRPTTPAAPLLGLHVRVGVVTERAVQAAARLLRPLFRPLAVLSVMVAVVAFDAWLLVAHGLGAASRQMIDQPVNIVLLGGLMLVAAGFHELGHATGCLYGGARPGRIGVGLYLAWPVFYNDVTDSYRLDRSGRLRTDLGGVYFNAIAVVVAAGTYAATGFEPLLVFVAVQHLVVLQQFLPFVRLDGYYVVSDLIGVPDLYRRMRPMVRSLLPWRGVDPAVSELRAGPRAAVALWVLVTVPALVAALGWLVAHGPALLRESFASLAVQVQGLSGAVAARDPVAGALAGMKVVSLAVPIVGISLVALRWAYRCVKALRARLPFGDARQPDRSCAVPGTGSDPVAESGATGDGSRNDARWPVPTLWLPGTTGAARSPQRLILPAAVGAHERSIVFHGLEGAWRPLGCHRCCVQDPLGQCSRTEVASVETYDGHRLSGLGTTERLARLDHSRTVPSRIRPTQNDRLPHSAVTAASPSRAGPQHDRRQLLAVYGPELARLNTVHHGIFRRPQGPTRTTPTGLCPLADAAHKELLPLARTVTQPRNHCPLRSLSTVGPGAFLPGMAHFTEQSNPEESL
ncbi:MAG: hypothetical protein KY441_11290 [Actinobacteria bacterium]|nr:hypothetical protein [Actinomycetota bacterium]